MNVIEEIGLELAVFYLPANTV